MPQTLTTQQLTQYLNKIKTQGVDGAKSVYQSMYAEGYNYAGWANGVASGNTLTGQFAMDYLSGSALMGLGGDACRNLTQQDMDKIRVDMAEGYINTLIKDANKNAGSINTDVTFKETKDFHEAAFGQNGLTNDNWTLEAPMELLRQDFGDDFVEKTWELLRGTGGDQADGVLASLALMSYMHLNHSIQIIL